MDTYGKLKELIERVSALEGRLDQIAAQIEGALDPVEGEDIAEVEAAADPHQRDLLAESRAL